MHFLFGFSKELLVFLRFGHDFLIYSLPFFRKSECWRRKGVGWNEFRQPLSYYGISERNVRFWSLNSRLDNRQADNPFMAMRERYFYGVLPFSSFCCSSWRKWNRADDSPLRGKGRSSALAAWLKESPHIRIKPRVWRWMCGLSFLRHNRLYHLRLLFLVESGTGIGTANHLPLTSEPQKVVRTAEAWEECPYVSVRASRIGIYGHTSFVGLRLFTLSCCSLFIFLFVESGTGIGTANHLPLTSEPQKVVRTAEAWEECPYVSVRASRIGIYGHTSFVGFGWFTLSSESPS